MPRSDATGDDLPRILGTPHVCTALSARDSETAKERRSRAMRFVTLSACMLIALIGCNSARVVRSNIERTVQNKGQLDPRAWPAHPYAPATVANPNDSTRPAEAQPPDDSDDEIIQATAQWPHSTTQTGQGPAGTGTITGRVVDSSGRPQSFVSIVASPTRRPGGGARVQAMTDQMGNFNLRGLEPGQRYLILATATRSPVALIGRVAAVAPQQGITIGVSRPHTADRQAEPQMSRRESQDHFGPDMIATSTNNSASGKFHAADPFSSPKGAIANSPSAPARTAPKQTREQAAANNRMSTPWDMPAPPTRKSSPVPSTRATTAPTQTRFADPTKPDSPSGWRQAGGNGNVRQPPAGGFSLLDSAPPSASAKQPGRAELSGTRESHPPDATASPYGSASQPLELDADAKPDRPKATLTKALSLPLGAPEHAMPSREPTAHLHESPMCQMDGKRLVDFQLDDVDGKPVCFNSINSRLVLIDFWTTSCPPCLRAIPHLVNLQKRFGGQGLQVVGIACEQGDLGERKARVAKIRNQLHISYPLLIDEGDDNSLVRDHFGVLNYPTLVLLDKSGKVLWRSEGPDQADMAQLENLLKTQLNRLTTRYN